jgi:prolyl 4-hydroxylase
VLAVATRIADTVGLPLVHAESLQVIHYEPGQEYRTHFDAYDLSTEKGQRYTERGGQRLVTALAYLGAVEGGTTDFSAASASPWRHDPAACWCSQLPPGTNVCDRRTEHQGRPPLRGDKWPQFVVPRAAVLA